MDDEKAILDKQLKGSLALTSLIAKVAAACDATGGVAKEGKNEQQGYAYVKAADVAKAIRHELFSRGVMVIPNELPPEFTVVELPSKFKEDTKRTMTECHLGVDYLLTDGNESLHFMAYGVARDSGDKAIYKAKTGALKYFLRGLGLIPDERDDPEFDEEGKEVTKRTPAEQREFADKKVAELREKFKAKPAMTRAADLIAGMDPEITSVITPEIIKKQLTGVITPAQQKRMFAIASQHGVPKETLRDLLGRYGFEHSNEVTIGQYDTIIADIESVVAK